MRILNKSIVTIIIISIFLTTIIPIDLFSTMTVTAKNSNDFSLDFIVDSQWNGAFNGRIILKNISNKTIENWILQLDFEHEITNIWNAKIVSHENTSYVIKNVEWNQNIKAGQTVEFGFSAKWINSINAPANYKLLNVEQVTNDTDYSIEYKLFSDWGAGFVGEISITNNTSETIEDWSLEFDFPRQIDSIWNANKIKHEGNHYIIKNAEYNANIKSGGTISFGFSGSKGLSSDIPNNFQLNKMGQESEDNYEKDSDGDGLPDLKKAAIHMFYRIMMQY